MVNILKINLHAASTVDIVIVPYLCCVSHSISLAVLRLSNFVFLFRLVKKFKDTWTKLYAFFVQSAIPMFDSFNTFLQATEPLIHVLHQSTLHL